MVGGDTSSFDVTFLRSSAPDGETPTELAPAGAVIGSTGTLVEAPPIIPREQWASGTWDYQNEACDEGPWVADHLQAVVVHHTVTANNYAEADVDDLLRAMYYSHVVVNGWCDIGYNFVVDRFGRIWEARTGSIEEAGDRRSLPGLQHLDGRRCPAWPASAGSPAKCRIAVVVGAAGGQGARPLEARHPRRRPGRERPG